MRTPLALAALLLSACGPMMQDSDVILFATEPPYHYTQEGRLVATTCRQPDGVTHLTYSALPPGCQRDQVFAAQVADPAHLTHPATPGPAAAVPIGRAANDYLYGGMAPGAVAPAVHPGGETRVIDLRGTDGAPE